MRYVTWEPERGFRASKVGWLSVTIRQNGNLTPLG